MPNRNAEDSVPYEKLLFLNRLGMTSRRQEQAPALPVKVTFCGASFIFAKNGRPHRVAPTFICRRHTSFFKRANTVRPYRVDDNYCCFHGTAELFKFNNRFGRERRPRRSVGFDAFSRSTARVVPTDCFSICSGRCPHRPKKDYSLFACGELVRRGRRTLRNYREFVLFRNAEDSVPYEDFVLSVKN